MHGAREEEQLKRILETVHMGCTDQVLAALDRMKMEDCWEEGFEHELCGSTLTHIRGIMKISSPLMRHHKCRELREIVEEVGVDEFRVMVVAMGMLCASRTYPDTRLLGAKCCAIAILSRLMARRMSMSPEEVWQVEIGGMFLPMGRMACLLYQHQAATQLEKNIIGVYHHTLGAMMAQCYGLPSYLRTIIDDEHHMRFGLNSFEISSLVRIAAASVNRNFAANGKLIIEAPMPDDTRQYITATVGSEIEEYFEALGFADFLSILPTPPVSQGRSMFNHALHPAEQQVAL